MSDFVVHFTKPGSDEGAYFRMLHILGSRVINAINPFGLMRETAPDPTSQKAVCLSEVPLHLLDRLAEKRSRYGIVFPKAVAIEKNANPILYAYKGQHLANALKSVVETAGNDPGHPIWQVTPFVDVPGQYATSTYFYEWEREWRVVGDLQFTTDEVAFLIIPEELHEKARRFFEDADAEQLGPGYHCPFIDAHWSLDKVKSLVPKST